MKKVFFEQYPMEEGEIRNFLGNGLLVFDTNVLLNLYFYTADTRNKMFGVMEKCRERLWMPYQVGWEYFNNRKDKIEKLHKSCDVISENIKDAKNRFAELLNEKYKRHPYIVRDEIIALFKDSLKPVEEKLKELKANDPDYAKKDTIWAKLEELFDGKVGKDYSLDKLQAIYKEGEDRYAFKIPPGYADMKEKKDRGPQHLYGDLIIWKMVIDQAKEKGLDVVLVTEDKKEDWFEKKREPRKDLAKEFFDESDGHKILICDQEEFLYLTDRFLDTGVGEDAIKEIKEVAVEERKSEEELRKRRAKSMEIIDGWNKKRKMTWANAALLESGSLWGAKLAAESLTGMAEMPWNALYDRSAGFINSALLPEDYLPKTIDASTWVIPEESKLFGELGQPPLDSILGLAEDDDKE
jgi:hypothetical protein